MMHLRSRRWITSLVAVALLLPGCGSSDDAAADTTLAATPATVEATTTTTSATTTQPPTTTTTPKSPFAAPAVYEQVARAYCSH
jgi:hypothetical protein